MPDKPQGAKMPEPVRPAGMCGPTGNPVDVPALFRSARPAPQISNLTIFYILDVPSRFDNFDNLIILII